MMRAGQESFFPWGELWADRNGSAEYADWEKLANRRGLDSSEINIKYHATRGLLSELLYGLPVLPLRLMHPMHSITL